MIFLAHNVLNEGTSGVLPMLY